MIIHNEDNTEVKMKITDEGDLFLFCPECNSIWETKLSAVKKPRETRQISYGEAKLNLDVDASGAAKAKSRKPSETTAIAKEIFPEAFK